MKNATLIQPHNVERVKEARDNIKEVMLLHWNDLSLGQFGRLDKALGGLDSFLEEQKMLET